MSRSARRDIPRFSTPLIETHCHLDYLAPAELTQVLEDARAVGIERIVTIAVSPDNLDTVLALAQGQLSFLAAALVFGAGFGLMYPAFTAYVMAHVPASRRGAAFGAMLAAFDTGIGTGSSALGWLVHQAGFRYAFGAAAGIALLSLPVFLVAEKRLGFDATTPSPEHAQR